MFMLKLDQDLLSKIQVFEKLALYGDKSSFLKAIAAEEKESEKSSKIKEK